MSFWQIPSLPDTSRKAFGKVLINEFRLAKRVPYALGLGLGLPILLLVIFGSIPSLHQSQKDFGGISYFALAVPILLGLSVAAISFLSLPNSLVTYREQGILRRLSTTPVPPSWLLAAQLIVNLGIAVLGLLLIIVVGMAAFGLAAPKNIPGFLLAILLTITSIFAVGLWIAAVAKNNNASRTEGGLLFYMMIFFGGMWVPREIMPPVLLNISNWTPLGASVASVQNSMQGVFPSGQALLCLAIYTLIFSFLAIRYFRWE